MKGKRCNGLYVLDGVTVIGSVSVASNVETNKTRLWHLRLAHMNERGLKELSKQGLLRNDKVETLELCEECVLGKANRHKFNLRIHRTCGGLLTFHL